MTLHRVGAYAGLLYVALIVAQLFTAAAPDPDAPGEEVARHFRDNGDAARLSVTAYALALPLLLVFAAGLGDVVSRRGLRTLGLFGAVLTFTVLQSGLPSRSL